MVCKYCGKPVILVPSASERARKFGGRPSDYTKLFEDHADCILEARRAAILKLINKET